MENDIQIENCCYICSKRSFNTEGICCGLTQYMVDYADCCEDFMMDENARKELQINIRDQKIEEQIWDNLSSFEKFLYKHSTLGMSIYFDKVTKAENEEDSKQMPE